MSTLAFVSHSYNPNDQDVVSKLLEYLDTVKDAIPGFDFRTAQKATPVEVHKKIDFLFHDCNLLIALCLKHEAVIDSEKLTKFCFSKNKKIINTSEFKYKTSDWIIQEIGYAIGKSMNIILLIEEGLRDPGEFQGNLQHITFSREDFSASFNPLLQMISSKGEDIVSQSITSISSVEIVNSVKPEISLKLEENKENKVVGDEQDKLNFSQYKVELRLAFSDGDRIKEKNIIDSFYGSEFYKVEANKLEFNSLTYYLEDFYRGTGTERLKELQNLHPKNFHVNYYYGHYLYEHQENALASNYFFIAAKLSSNSEAKISLYGLAAIALLKSNDKKLGLKYLGEAKEISSQETKTDCKIEYLRQLIKYFKEANEIDLFVAYSEKLLKLEPYHFGIRFDLAYQYWSIKLYGLSYFHYHKLEKSNPSDSISNNIGVSASSLNLESKSIQYYKQAIAKGNTLAMSNLADKLSNSGFLDEAKEYCNQAMLNKYYHDNIITSLKTIKDKEAIENAEEEKALKAAEKDHDLFASLGDSLLEDKFENLKSKWKFPNYVLEITIIEDEFTGKGEYYETKIRNLLQIGSTDIKTTLLVFFNGKITGKAIFFQSEIYRNTKEKDNLYESGNGFIFENSQKEILMVDRSKGELIVTKIETAVE
jgi:hypothetical protein